MVRLNLKHVYEHEIYSYSMVLIQAHNHLAEKEIGETKKAHCGNPCICQHDAIKVARDLNALI